MPTLACWFVAVTGWSEPDPGTSFVAEKVTVGSPLTVAVAVLVPAPVPTVQLLSCAMPLAFVVTDEGLTDPPPDVAANATETP